MKAIKQIIGHIVNGLKCGYPFCCILDFSLFGRSASQAGTIQHKNGEWYVPCRLCQNKAISLREQLSILNMGDITWFIGLMPDETETPDAAD